MKKYIVTGASGGIGQSIIDKMIDDGIDAYNILGIYNSNLPRNCLSFKCDFAKNDKLDFFHYIKEDDELILINCAGITVNRAFQKYDWHEIKKQFDVNVFGGIKLAQHLWAHMKRAKYGRIIFMSSVVPHRPVFGTLGYSASKSALSGVASELAVEGAKYNIYTGNIACGYTDVGMIKDAPLEVQKAIKENSPLKRLINMDEVYNTITYIINTPAITGQTLHLNGGLYYG